MRSPLATLRNTILTLAILVIGWGGPSGATAAHKAVDFKCAVEGASAGFAILLDSLPGYSLKTLPENRISLTLFDTVKTPQLERRLAGEDGRVTLDDKGISASLRFVIRLGTDLSEIRTAWLAKEKHLMLFMTLAKGKGRIRGANGKSVTLKNLRFGIQDTYTRMVVDLSKEPPWELIHKRSDRVTLRLEAERVTLKRKKFSGLRRVLDVTLNQKKHHVDVDVRLDHPTAHFRIFWLEQGNKLVTDFNDRPPDALDDSLRLHVDERTPDQDGLKGTAEVVPKGEDLAGRFKGGEEVREDREKAERAGEPNGSLKQEVGFVVRQRIPREPRSDRRVPGDAKPVPPKVHEVEVKIEPDIEKAPPKGLYNRAWVNHLSADEAFLIGRIQEAWEIKGYGKGVELMERFLKEFPDSPLNETISFLIGDFRLALLKRGDKDIFPKVINSYADAVARFKKSGKVPLTLVRMAQANCFVGRDYEAVGYLNTAVTRFSTGAHLPLAHLTRGKVFLRINQPERAIDDLKIVLDRFPQSSSMEEARYEIARYFYSIGAYEEAGRRFEELVDLNSVFHLDYPESLSLTARNYAYLKDYDKSREYYFKALNLGHQPERPGLLLSHIGDTYHQQSKEREAEKFYRMAIEQDPEGEGAAIAKLRLADYSSGVTAFQQIHKENLNSAIGDLALLNLGMRYYEQKQYAMAMDTLRKLMEKPNQSEIFVKAKDLYSRAVEEEVKRFFRAGDYAKIIDLRESQKIPSIGKTDPEVYLMVARSYHHLRRYPEAVRLFESIKPFDLSLTSKGGYFQDKADSYIQIEEADKAERLLEQARKKKLIAADRQKITVLLAGLLRNRGDLKGAYGLYDGLVTGKRMLPDTKIAGVYLEMGKISNAERRFERAREALNRCIALTEKDKGGRELVQAAFIEMGNGYHKEGNHKQSIRFFREAFDLGYGPEMRDYWECNYRLALAYLKTGNNEEAERLFEAISEEGDPILQQKVQIKMGMIDLEKQLKRLPVARNVDEASL